MKFIRFNGSSNSMISRDSSPLPSSKVVYLKKLFKYLLDFMFPRENIMLKIITEEKAYYAFLSLLLLRCGYFRKKKVKKNISFIL